MDSIAGVYTPTIDLVLTLPTKRGDGSALAASEIQSVTVLRDSGSGPKELIVLPGTFNGATALYTDPSPASGGETYSFYVTDTAGARGATSPAVVMKGSIPVKAPPAAGVMTAVEKTPVVASGAPVMAPGSAQPVVK
jgi:hypothetical protein